MRQSTRASAAATLPLSPSDDGESSEQTARCRADPSRVTGSVCPRSKPPRGEREQPDEREPRSDDGERHGRDREVVEPDDRREDERRRRGQREATPAPRPAQQRAPAARVARRPPLEPPVCTRSPRMGSVLVERLGRAQSNAEVLVEAVNGSKSRARRPRAWPRLPPERAPGGEPDAERPAEELDRSCDADCDARASRRSRVRQAIAVSRQSSGVRCETRISPITCGQSAKRRRPASRGRRRARAKAQSRSARGRPSRRRRSRRATASTAP